MVNTFNKDTFAKAITKGICVVDFWASWCFPCRTMAPIIDEIANENADVMVGKVDVDEFPELAGDYDVMSIPTLLFFKDGALMDHSVGVVGKNIVQRKIDALK